MVFVDGGANCNPQSEIRRDTQSKQKEEQEEKTK